MGFQDRDYYRQPMQANYGSGTSMPIVYKIIILNAILWVANGLFTPNGGISNALALHMCDVYKPWLWWKFLTCGFVHAPGFYHILGNMLGLFFLGPYVEMRYGKKEFLGFYLMSIIAGSVVWVISGYYDGIMTPTSMHGVVGASGGVTATVILFAMTFPKVMLYLYFLIPVPAWLCGLLIVGLDFWGALQQAMASSPNTPFTHVAPNANQVAYTVHLASAAFAVLYYRFHWRLDWFGAFFTGGLISVPSARDKYHIYDDDDDGFSHSSRYTEAPAPTLRPDRERATLPESSEELGNRERQQRKIEEMRDEVDRILRKISMTGRNSLTRAEERTLQAASEFFQKNKLP